MSVFEGGKSLGVAGVSVPFLVLIPKERISLVLCLLGAHEATLRSLEADETELFL